MTDDIDKVLFEKLSTSKFGEEASAALNEYTRQKIREGTWWQTRCRPWLLKFMDWRAGRGENPGPRPPRYPPIE